MAREKELYRDNLERLDGMFPNKELLTVKDVQKYCGISDDRAKRLFPFTMEKCKNGGYRYHISKVKLASCLS